MGKEFASKIAKSKTHIDDYLKRIRQNTKSILLYPVTPTELDRLLNQIPKKNSAGYDDISNVLLKEIKPLILKPLVYIFNMSLSTGVFPKAMKKALVVPLYKGSARDELNNYRPISLLITLSKVLEKTMYTRVYNFLNDTNQIYDSQYGFRAKHSCNHAIGELISKITKGCEQGNQTVCAFLDLSKAFDTLEHSVIFIKMERYGLRGMCLNWFKSYLDGRTLKVRCNTGGGVSTSVEFKVEYGAPQGSCLWPLIFLIFCNNLHLHLLYLDIIQFVDDTTLCMGHKSIKYINFSFETDLSMIQDWFNANKLTLNVSKSVVMHFGTNCRSGSTNLKIKIGNGFLPLVKSTKFLGVHLDDQLVWSEHLKRLHLKIKHGDQFKSGTVCLNKRRTILWFSKKTRPRERSW